MACRQAQPEDAAAIASVHVHAWQTAYRNLMPADFLGSLTTDAAERRWEKWLHSSPGQIWVVEKSGSVAGFCHFGASRDSDSAAGVGEIRAINLHPDHWRKGLGAQLLAASLLELAGEGFAASTLWVLEENPSARRFYEALGWHADGALKAEAPDGCPPLDHLRYRVAIEI